jgi:hypothetical protein
MSELKSQDDTAAVTATPEVLDALGAEFRLVREEIDSRARGFLGSRMSWSHAHQQDFLAFWMKFAVAIKRGDVAAMREVIEAQRAWGEAFIADHKERHEAEHRERAKAEAEGRLLSGEYTEAQIRAAGGALAVPSPYRGRSE